MELNLVKNKKCNSCDTIYYDEDCIEINLNGIVTRFCKTCARELIIKITREL